MQVHRLRLDAALKVTVTDPDGDAFKAAGCVSYAVHVLIS